LAVLAAALLVLAGYAALQSTGYADSRPRSAPARPAADARLVLRRHAEPFASTIAGGVVLNGILSPSLPGVNTIRLTIRLPGRQPARGGRVHLVLTMPGMAMPPVRATLVARHHGFGGSVALPMFGDYRAQVDADLDGGRYRGSLNMRLPLVLNAHPAPDHIGS
jgi:hypothetical protein